MVEEVTARADVDAIRFSESDVRITLVDVWNNYAETSFLKELVTMAQVKVHTGGSDHKKEPSEK